MRLEYVSYETTLCAIGNKKSEENSKKEKKTRKIKSKSKWWREENLDVADERSRRTLKTTVKENK